MPQRLKLIIAYDGAGFSGWQSQPNRNGVQDYLESAFARISGTRLQVHGAGRTDAGAHALGQCAHVDLPHGRLSPAGWASALNALLPPAIRVLRCRYVPGSFHARFSARGKVYRYRIWSAPILPPLEFKRAWHIPSPINIEMLKAAAAEFVGVHDFAAFAANRGKPEENTTRRIHCVHVGRKGPCITMQIDGDGFLYKMVRLMVGSMAQYAQARLKLDEIRARLVSGRSAGPRPLAPAEGLFLVRVKY
jgi:tRNA pseudouridine38-40 synthase